MRLSSLAFAYLRAKWLNTALHVTLMLLGMMMITILLLFNHQIRGKLLANSAGVDAVVGAKGSPLQLVLSSIHHIDIPSGNIALSEAMRLKRHTSVRRVIPLSLGDSYQNFRIVGTEAAYLKHFNAAYARGSVWETSMQAVVGATVARQTGIDVGKHFIGAHGLLSGGHSHDDHPYRVVGVLKPTGTVLDRLIITSLDSVWDIHATEKRGIEDSEKEITALLVTYKNPAANFTFPRYINQKTNMQAASPTFEMVKLFELIGLGTNTMLIFGGLLVAVSLISVFIGLLNSIHNRRYDLAIFRVLGASRKDIFLLVVIEGMLISFAGSLLGMLTGHGATKLIGMFTQKGMELRLEGFIFLPELYALWGVVLALSLIACVIPAWRVYKSDIHTTLTHA